MYWVRRRRGGDRVQGRGGEVFKQLPHSSPRTLGHSCWVRVPASSFVITGAVFVVFVLDMTSPEYGQFALIPDLRPQIATLTADVRSDLENLTRFKSLPTPTKKIQKQFGSDNCRTLLDAYKGGEVCHFEPANYSNTSLQKSNTEK